MTKRILTVTLNPSLDKVLYVSKMCCGKTSSAHRIELNAGGKGVNVARALQRFSALFNHLQMQSGDVVATGFCGGLAGEHFRKMLSQDKIKDAFCLIKGETRTNLTMVDKYHKRTRVVELGPVVDISEWRVFRRKYDQLLGRSDIVVLSGRNVQGLKDNVWRELIEIAHQKKLICCLDSSGKAFREGLRAAPEFIKPNQDEAEEILGYSLSSLAKIKKGLFKLNQLGAKTVMLSLGLKGVWVSNVQGIWQAHAETDFTPSNDVGCGDSYVAGFMGMFARGEKWENCIRMGVAFGMANMLSMIPGGINIQDVKKFYKIVNVKKIV